MIAAAAFLELAVFCIYRLERAAGVHAGPKTTTEIVKAFPEMTRHAVMKHIDVLRDATLVNTREDGRRRVNSLNVVPIRRIYERWIGPFAELWSSTLLRIKDDVETGRRSGRG